LVLTLYRSNKDPEKSPVIDSSYLSYAGKPFNGDMFIHFHSSRFKEKYSIKKKGNKLNVDIVSKEHAAEEIGDYFTTEQYYADDKSENHFVNGKLDGFRKVHNYKRDVILTENRKNSRLEGERCWYDYCYKDTAYSYRRKQNIYCMESKSNYKDGLLEGESTSFNSYGGIYSVAHYSKGLLNGNWVTYNNNGTIALTSNYLNDSLEGKYMAYDDKGRLLQDLNFKKGALDGVNYFHSQADPMPTLEVHCKQGFLVDTSYEYYKGTKIAKKKLQCNISDSSSYSYYNGGEDNYYND
jgi:antitoxin component YwqK of YwqJK toxin-antitoxin module